MRTVPNYSKLCVECRYYSPSKGLDVCRRPVNLVTGKASPRSASTERGKHGSCGPKGLNWEAASAKEAAE